MCGGFTCTKNALKALNLLYIVVALILASTATYMKTVGQIHDRTLIGGLIVLSLFLFLLSLLGLVGTSKHHQVMLFFYMVILFLLFLAQFSIACVLLASTSEQQRNVAQNNWNASSGEEKQNIQQNFDCCGFLDTDPKSSILCPNVRCCQLNEQMGQCSQCSSCNHKIEQAMAEAFDVVGWFGLFFSLTELAGVWLTVRFRNQKNPRANPNAFL